MEIKRKGVFEIWRLPGFVFAVFGVKRIPTTQCVWIEPNIGATIRCFVAVFIYLSHTQITPLRFVTNQRKITIPQRMSAFGL